MTKKSPLKIFVLLVATFFGTGFFPKAPGTIGTFAAWFFWMALGTFFFPSFSPSPFYSLMMAFFCFCLGLTSTYLIEKHHYLAHDAGSIVIDEAFGLYLSFFIFQIFYSEALSLSHQALLLIFFRFFDILKPWPISFVDRSLKSAWGVMLDDGIAGLFSSIVLISIMKLKGIL